MKKSILYPNLAGYKQFNQIASDTLHLNKKVQSNEYKIAQSILSATHTLIEHDFRHSYEFFWEDQENPFPISQWRQCRHFQPDEILTVLELSQTKHLDLMLYECTLLKKDFLPDFDIVLAQLFNSHWQQQILDKHQNWTTETFNFKLYSYFFEEISLSPYELNFHKLNQYFTIEKQLDSCPSILKEIWNNINLSKKDNFFYRALNNDLMYEHSSTLLEYHLKPLVDYLQSSRSDIVLDNLAYYITKNQPSAFPQEALTQIEKLIKLHEYQCLDATLEHKEITKKMKI